MSSLNKTMLIGHIGSDPEIRYLPNGTPTASITIATTDTWTDKETNEKKEKTEWHRVVFFRGLAEVVKEYLKKGSQVYIEGKLRTRKWNDKEGVVRYTTEIVADEMRMLGKKPLDGTPSDHSESSHRGDEDDDIPEF